MLGKMRLKLGRIHRREGDRRRDLRDWPKAAAAYRRHLGAHPGDAAIWVQLGHAVKEQGQISDAEGYYRRAASLTPDDADVQLQLGHVLKLAGRFDEAVEAYRHSLILKPSADAALELRRLRPKAGNALVPALGQGTTFFSIQDLFVYLHAHPTMSGIQRVQAGIALHAMDDETIDSRFIINDMSGTLENRFLLIDKTLLRNIIVYAASDKVDHAVLKDMLANAELMADWIRPAAGSNLILLGAFWGLGNTIDRYVAAKRDGVRIGAYIYDIIPITHPEYCDPILTRDFAMSLSELAQVVDFIFTISDYTRKVVGQFVEANGLTPVPMYTVPLAHALTTEPTLDETWPAQLRKVKRRRYVAYISTVEGRKNHIYVVNAWRRMIADGLDPPDLVFVGRHGWRISALVELLEATGNLGGRVHIVHGLSDAEVNAVYRHAMFTVFTSFVEGWGLPVGESLIHGVPCVASSESSIPEVGGEFVDYVDPYNLTQGIAVFRRMIEDVTYRDARANQIRESFNARTWRDVALDFVENIRAIERRGDVVRRGETLLPDGRLCEFGLLGPDEFDIGTYIKAPSRLLLVEGFYPAEREGSWMRGGSARITFRTPCEPGEEVLIYLDFYPAPGGEGRLFSVQAEDPDGGRLPPPRHLRVAARNLVRLKAVIDADRVVNVRVDIKGEVGPFTPDDPRLLSIGLRAIGYARAEDVVARANLMEELTFQSVAAS